MKSVFVMSLAAAGALALGAFALQGANLSVPVMNWAKPVEQHEFLRSLEGIWDAEVRMFRNEGEPPFTYSCQETVRSACGGLYTTIELEGGDKENGFASRSLIGFDPKMSKFNAIIADKSGTTWSKLEGQLSKDSKTFTLNGDGPDLRYVDKRSKFEYVWTFGKKNERTTTVTLLEDDGGRTKWMEIEYKFKKKK
jgi:hypothetical protein